MQIRALLDVMGEETDSPPAKSLNGVRFRTLCVRCNSSMLGGRYDPALAYFSNSVAALSLATSLPDVVTIQRVKPQKIMRAAFGHLAALGISGFSEYRDQEALRVWFASGEGPLPQNWRFYYWLYPFKARIATRHLTMMDIGTDGPMRDRIHHLWLMKFFPLAMMFTINDGANQELKGLLQNPQYHANLFQFTQYGDLAADEEIDIPLAIRPLIHPWWPQSPSDNSILAGHLDSPGIYAIERLVGSPTVP